MLLVELSKICLGIVFLAVWFGLAIILEHGITFWFKLRQHRRYMRAYDRYVQRDWKSPDIWKGHDR